MGRRPLRCPVRKMVSTYDGAPLGRLVWLLAGSYRLGSIKATISRRDAVIQKGDSMALHRVSGTHGIDDRNLSVLVPMPADRQPTCGPNVRLKRNISVCDADGNVLRGPAGGRRRKANPEDGEYLADRRTRINVKVHSALRGAENPLALGDAVFRKPFEPDIENGWRPNMAKRGNRFDHLVALYRAGYEIRGESARTMRRIAEKAAKLG